LSSTFAGGQRRETGLATLLGIDDPRERRRQQEDCRDAGRDEQTAADQQ
jgi:hypothetical protein